MRALALLALAGAAAASPADDPRAGRVAGEPRRCVTLDQTRALQIVDPRTLVLRQTARRIWVTRPEEGCFPLNRNDVLVLEMWGGRLCRGDRFRTVTPGMSIPSATCRLGDFIPYDKPK